MEQYNAEIIKTWITQGGVIYGINVAHLFKMEHLVFHDRLYKYYHNPVNTPSQEEPLMYWRDPDTREMVHMNAEFPSCMSLTLKNYGAPTYGIEAKHIDDLYAAFADKTEIIDTIKHAFEINQA